MTINASATGSCLGPRWEVPFTSQTFKLISTLPLPTKSIPSFNLRPRFRPFRSYSTPFNSNFGYAYVQHNQNAMLETGKMSLHFVKRFFISSHAFLLMQLLSCFYLSCFFTPALLSTTALWCRKI